MLQGCPLSGTLFAFVVDPLLWSFKRYLTGTLTRACADDVGMALRKLEMLALVYRMFEDYRRVSNLTLKPAKCILITTVCKSSSWNHDMIRAFLRRNVPGWANIIIKDSAKYLGFIVGPTAGAVQWDGALEKFNGRCIALRLSEQPLSLKVGQFSGRAISVLGYIAQLVPPLKKHNTY